MSTWIKDALSGAGISYRALAERLRPAYPKASAPAITAACNPADTGVTFTAAAAKIIATLTGFSRPRVERRRCPVRIQARLSTGDARAFNAARKAMGHRTVNDALVYALHWYIAEGKKRAAAAAGTDRDGMEKETVIIIAEQEEHVNAESNIPHRPALPGPGAAHDSVG